MIPALLLCGLALADAQQGFDAGVAAARSGDYAAAEQHFREALTEGGRDPAVYHGLGEALYRQGRLGLAIAAWERGHALAPLDGDLRANLEHARGKAQDRIDAPQPELGPFFWQRSLSARQSGGLMSGLLTLALMGALVARAAPTSRLGALARRLRGLWAALGVLGLLLLASTAALLRGAPAAVVTAPEVTARSTPGPDGVELFSLHEGATVAVREADADQAQVQLPDGRKGWLPWSALASTDPAAPFPASGL